MRLNKVTFPPYREVIPSGFDDNEGLRVSVDKKAMLDAAASFVALKLGLTPMRMRLEDGQIIMVTASDLDRPEGRQSIGVDGLLNSEHEIGLNPKYVQEALSLIPDERVELYWEGNLDAFVISDHTHDNLVVCMPMRF